MPKEFGNPAFGNNTGIVKSVFFAQAARLLQLLHWHSAALRCGTTLSVAPSTLGQRGHVARRASLISNKQLYLINAVKPRELA